MADFSDGNAGGGRSAGNAVALERCGIQDRRVPIRAAISFRKIVGMILEFDSSFR